MTKATIRAFRLSDASRLAELVYACNLADGWAHRETAESLEPCGVADPTVPPERFWLVAEAAGRLVGLATLVREKGTRLYALPWVLPEWRGRGIERDLIAGMSLNAQGLDEPVLDVPVRPTQPTYAAALESELGFSVVRTWYVMRIELNRDLPAPIFPPGVSLRQFVPGQDEVMLTGLINDVFWDHWGEGTHTLDEIQHDVSPPFDPGLLLFVQRAGQVLGYVWGWLNPELVRVTGEGCVYIGDLGMRPAYRRQGLGRALLLHELRELRARGLTAAELDMDGPNANARRLYESLGFYAKQEVRWFRRELRSQRQEATAQGH